MKRYFILSILPSLFTYFHSSAQLISKRDSADFTVKTYLIQDTIHVRGKITTPAGKPLGGLVIFAGAQRYYFEESPKNYTDSLGRFHIDYVEPNDTLNIIGSAYSMRIPVQGGRFFHITLNERIDGPLDTLRIKGINKKQANKEPIRYTTKIQNGVFPGAIEVHASFPGGMKSFYKYLQNTVKYPTQAEEKGIEGLVSLSFYISKSGQPCDFNVIRGLGYGIEEALIAAIEAVKWKPALFYGRTVERKVEINMQFSLSE